MVFPIWSHHQLNDICLCHEITESGVGEDIKGCFSWEVQKLGPRLLLLVDLLIRLGDWQSVLSELRVAR